MAGAAAAREHRQVRQVRQGGFLPLLQGPLQDAGQTEKICPRASGLLMFASSQNLTW